MARFADVASVERAPLEPALEPPLVGLPLLLHPSVSNWAVPEPPSADLMMSVTFDINNLCN